MAASVPIRRTQLGHKEADPLQVGWCGSAGVGLEGELSVPWLQFIRGDRITPSP
jgi:hypothetical protein